MGRRKSNELTQIDIKILEDIKDSILNRGYPPTVREICADVGLSSTSSVHGHLEKLERMGLIRKDRATSRTIELVENDVNPTRREITHLPIVGQVAAGTPILVDENIEDYFPVPSNILPKSTTFMLRVKGDSMINAGIFDRDLVIVEKTSTVSNGEIVVAMLEDSATVKRFYKEDGFYRLQPENDAMEPIISDKVYIIGKVVGLIRMMR